jgi:hypothetical protein
MLINLLPRRCAACETPKPGTKAAEPAKSRYIKWAEERVVYNWLTVSLPLSRIRSFCLTRIRPITVECLDLFN